MPESRWTTWRSVFRSGAVIGLVAGAWSGCGQTDREGVDTVSPEPDADTAPMMPPDAAMQDDSAEGDGTDDSGDTAPDSALPDAADTAPDTADTAPDTADTAPDTADTAPVSEADALEGYERYTQAALDYALLACECLGARDAVLEGCARADAAEYGRLRIDNVDTKRCFEQELAPAFPDLVACETQQLESRRLCLAARPSNMCEGGLDECNDDECEALPGFSEYRLLKDRCSQILYCDDGEERVAMGRRCDDQVDCTDQSDEADCD